MELKLDKIIESTQEVCYKAFTEPENLSRWFTTNAKADLKEGGRYSNDDLDEGEFIELKPFERVRFTWENNKHCPGTEVQIDFISEDHGRTKIMLTHSKLGSEFHVNDMKKGWRWALDNVKLYLEKGKTITFEEWLASSKRGNESLIAQNILSKKFYEQYVMMIDWVNIYINALNDEEFQLELSPGKNHGVWILGHMITSDDDFSYYMGRGDLVFPEYQKLFGQGSRLEPPEIYPPVTKLREQWKLIYEKNKKVYESLTDGEFENDPENMSDEMKTYFSTKGKVVMAWQLHQMYHAGQLGLLAARAGKKLF